MSTSYRTPSGNLKKKCPNCHSLISTRGLARHMQSNACKFRTYWRSTIVELDAEIAAWKRAGFIRSGSIGTMLRSCGIDTPYVLKSYSFGFPYDLELRNMYKLKKAGKVSLIPPEWLDRNQRIRKPPHLFKVRRVEIPAGPYWAVMIAKAIEYTRKYRRDRRNKPCSVSLYTCVAAPGNRVMRRTMLLHAREDEHLRTLLEAQARMLFMTVEGRRAQEQWIDLLWHKYRQESQEWWRKNKAFINVKE